ncbi:SDR family NAD(P)-dependent oxidoreductase [Nostocaceae cyanobacterium CENA357]|uniref:SDR family NAD(P)-dependent oxidoreductase n=1 Tax=Atlanticothrix silvestris CENA357 TaxID=1725252 RepID=A0A8J7L428_9CYAN|nr:type I polyketide synthase [Atlanticothrix silvestris]MBH8553202.1 SDR family NAD(P)-dependent oxidoreductase [Atlanticothrix silvestris CENA357]
MNPNSENTNYRLLLENAILELRRMRSEVDTVEQLQKEPIAIIGMSCRLPGGVNNPDDYWNLLHNGVDAISKIPAQRWPVDEFYHPDPDMLGKMYTQYGGFLNEVDKFDAQFFGISPREAVSLDPQQRLLLEVSWEALENAGQAPEQLNGSLTGVFVGLSMDDYAQQSFYGDRTQIDAYNTLSILRSMAAGRLAYVLGLQGSTMQLDTACSSSLLGVHLACQSLRSQECNMALAGGVNLILSPDPSIGLCKLKALSTDGRCKTFDASADGYGRGEGCGIVVLKRLSDALADGDPILALIRGSAYNHDGSSNGLTAPNGSAQEKLLRKALENANVQAHQIQYVETHGTGTPLGDPIEVLALGAVLGQGRSQDNALAIGSVKTQVGHLESAAGVAGLMKVVLALQHAEIPPHLHLQQPNPYISWEKLPVVVPTQPTQWPLGTDGRRLAGVSSFGMSGTNVHLILEAVPEIKSVQPKTERPLHFLSLSAKTESALQSLVSRYESFLGGDAKVNLADICFSANTGRSHFDYRLAVVAESTVHLRQQLAAFAAGKTPALSGQLHNKKRPKIAFLFTGQGSQYIGMGRQLYETQPTFRQTLDRCDEILRPYLEQPLLSVLYPESGTSSLNDTAYTQPALFALEYALFQLWKSWGIEPTVVMGHSLGEYVAACIAGVFSLEDGLKLVAARARLMQASPQDGAMVNVFASEVRVLAAIQPYANQVSIAAINGPESVVISGQHQAVAAAVSTLQSEGVNSVKLNVSHAFHSPLMEPVLAEFERIASEVSFSSPNIKLISNVTGTLVTTEIANAEYWLRHLRQSVRFAAGMETLEQQGCEIFLEVGPKPTLLGMGRKCIPEKIGVWLPSLRPGQSDWQQLLQSLQELYLRGASINWSGFDQDYPRRRLVLPNYPFQRQRYWVETSHRQQTLPAKDSKNLHPVLGQRLKLPFSPEIRFETQFSSNSPAYLEDHQLNEVRIVPGASYISMILSAVKEAFPNESCIIEDLLFQNTLVCPDDGSTTVQLVLTPKTTEETSFQIISFLGGEAENEVNSWKKNGTGKVRLFSPVPNFVDVAEVKARCSQVLSGTQFYSSFQEVGYSWGTSFQWLENIWHQNGEAVCQMKLPQLPDELDNYQLYPGLIDSCLQLLNVCWDVNPAEQVQNDYMYIPFSIGSFRFYGRSSFGSQLWCHAQKTQTSNNQSLIGNVHLFDQNGQLIAEIIGFEVRKVRRATLLQSLQKDLGDWLYEVAWKAKPREQNYQLAQAQELGSWLIFADKQGTGVKLAKQLRERGDRTILVSPGSGYQVDAEHYYINPSEPQDFQRLIQDQPACRGIVYLWGLENESIADFQDTQVTGCGSVLHLVQALAKSTWSKSPRLWLVTKGAQPVEPMSESLAITQAALWGLGRVIALEHSELSCVRLDLDPADNGNEVEDLFTELLFPDQEDEVALRQGVRKVSRLVRRQAQTPVNQLAVHEDGTYLITGGLGALGLQVAQWMVAQGAKNLVLTGRRGVAGTAQAAINQLEQAGAKVLVVTADVSNSGDVAQVLEGIQTSYPPLRGIFHAAGVLDDGVLMQQNWSRFAKVLAPKVSGAWNLHILTKDLPLDFFVCFSSVASLLGSPSQGNYAAANAFMDALVHYRRNLGLPGLSINWGPWAEAGMAADLDSRSQQRIAESGFATMSSELGLQLLGDLLRQDATQVGVMSVNWAKFLQQFPPGGAAPLISDLAPKTQQQTNSAQPAKQLELLRQLEETIASDRENVLIAYIQTEVAQVLRFEASYQPNPQQGFFDMGMDSLMSIELKNRLETSLGNSLPSTLTFEYPTIESLADYLLNKVITLNIAEPIEVESQIETENQTDLLIDIQQYSEDELAALVDQELEALLGV